MLAMTIMTSFSAFWYLIVHLIFLISLIIANHDNGPNKLHECKLCECFVEYTDRDIWTPLQPYTVAATPLDVTQDECLSLCLRDSANCKGVVYGLVGGRNIYTCELYGNVSSSESPQYVYGLNAFVPRVSMPCMVDIEQFRLVDINDEPDDSPTKRKQFYQKLYGQPNPFYWGRRRRRRAALLRKYRRF